MAAEPSIWKKHDTWPPLRGKAEDEAGILDLTKADSLKVLIKEENGTELIEGVAEAIDPGSNGGYNWQYKWAAGDLAIVGKYLVELEVTWDALAVPPSVQSFPNKYTENPKLEVVPDLDDK